MTSEPTNDCIILSLKSKDKTGQRFGLLTAVKPVKKEHQSWQWLFLCDCGKSRVTWAHVAKAVGHCGCKTKANLANRGSHKQSHTPIYKVWHAMKARCFNAQNKFYPYYGGRGITVCEQWSGPHGFKQFIADMGQRPESGTLERVDVNGNYCPENCIWASRKQQQRNRRCNRLVDGKTIPEWAEISGISHGTISGRLNRGMPLHIAITKPVMEKHRNKRSHGITQ